MSTSSDSDLVQLCERRLEHHLHQSPVAPLDLARAQAIAEIHKHLQHNLESGRFERLQKHYRTPRGLTLESYVDLVIKYWIEEHARVSRLAGRDRAEWERLGRMLMGRARSMLRCYPQLSAAQSAEDFAQSACERIDKSLYPFDVPFDAWATTILQRLVFETPRSKDVLDKPHDSMDASYNASQNDPPASERRAGESGESVYALIEKRDVLERALSQMASQLQRQVIVMTFLEGLDDAEIARRLGKTKSNVQTLRHRGLVQLARILDRE